jgi:hypothetical protein
VCAFGYLVIRRFYLPFLREAVRAIGSRGTAKKHKDIFELFVG